MGTAKMVFDGDSAKLRAELDKVVKSEQTLIGQVQILGKESEKAQAQLLKEVELRKKANAEKKEAVEQARKLTTETEKQGKEIDKLRGKLQQADKAQGGMVASGLSGAQSLVLQYVGLQQVLGHVQAAMQRTDEISRRSLSTSERIARAQRQVMLNMPGATPSQVSSVDARIRAAATASRAPDLAAFYESVASGSAATGGNINAAIAGTAATVPFTRLAPQDLPVMSAAALEIGKSAGSSDYERSIGMLLQVSGVSRQPNNADIARSLPEALAAGVSYSSSPVAGMEFAAESYATLSNRVADVTGKQTSTAVANLVGKMDTFFSDKPNDPGTPGARFAAIQSDPVLREEFLGMVAGEVVFRGPLRDMLTPGTDVANELTKNQAAIDWNTASGMYGSTATNVTGGTEELRSAEAAAITAGMTETALLGPGIGDRAFAKQQLDAAITAAMPGNAEYLWGGYSRQLVYNTGVEMGTGTPYEIAATEVQGILAGEQAQLRSNPNDAAQQQVVDTLQQILATLQRQESNRAAGSGTTREE